MGFLTSAQLCDALEPVRQEPTVLDWLKRRLGAAASPIDEASLGEPVPDWRTRGDACVERKAFDEAVHYYEEAARSDPKDARTRTSLGFACMQLGRNAEAAQWLREALAMAPDDADSHYMLGNLHEADGRPELAARHLRAAVDLSPGFELAVRDLARVLATAGDVAGASDLLVAAIARNDCIADFHFYLGNLRLIAKEAQQAATDYRRALAIEPRHAQAWLQLGRALDECGDRALALDATQRALSVDPQHTDAHRAAAGLQLRMGRPSDAVKAYREALALAPSDASTWSDLGHALRASGRASDALRACERAVALDSRLAAAHNNMGNALVDQKRAAEAIACYERALALDSSLVTALVNMAQTLSSLRRYGEAVGALNRALALDPRADWVLGTRLHIQMRLCDWRDYASSVSTLKRLIDEGVPVAMPWTVLALPLTPVQQRECARTYVERLNLPEPGAFGARKRGHRIRVGYFSADFHGHATAYLMAELFERHDRNRFEIVAFSFGPRSDHPMRRRLEVAFDQFLDVSDFSEDEIAAKSRELSIDIGVDLKGFTEDSRPGIFARRAAPVQVSYLGYPGSMGAPFIDYLVADGHVIPPAAALAYAEKIVSLPNSFQVNDTRRLAAAECPSRRELGLPEMAPVFCCFNNSYKITPDVFDVWMRVLHAVPNSVLWLLEDTRDAAASLRTEARRRGIDATRLVFAPRIAMPEHLARHREADLFLDTFHCNAHTTASDALWAGLPLLTCTGETFASRVAGSLLYALGMPELVAATPVDYERLAIELATDRPRLDALRRHVGQARSEGRLFDTSAFVNCLEAAYAAMWQRHEAGLAPDHLRISSWFSHAWSRE